jgi:hypothetical protein
LYEQDGYDAGGFNEGDEEDAYYGLCFMLEMIQ